MKQAMFCCPDIIAFCHYFTGLPGRLIRMPHSSESVAEQICKKHGLAQFLMRCWRTYSVPSTVSEALSCQRQVSFYHIYIGKQNGNGFRQGFKPNWGRTFVPTNLIQTANQISSHPTSGANEAYVSFTYSTGQHPHFGLQETSRQFNVNDFGTQLMRLFSVRHPQGNKAFAGEAGICPLSRVPSDSRSGGQLVPPQTPACQKWPGANECEHTAASYLRCHQIDSFLCDTKDNVYLFKMLIYAQFSFLCVFFLQVLLQHAKMNGDHRLLNFYSLVASSSSWILFIAASLWNHTSWLVYPQF